MLSTKKKYFCCQFSIKYLAGRLAPAYFSPNYKYFDQLLQTVKNKIIVLILVFKEFLQINSTTDFCTLCKRVSRFSLEKISSQCRNFGYRKMLGIREGVSRLSVENFLSHSAENFRRGTLQCFINFGYRKILCLWISRFSIENLLSHSAEKFRRGTLLCCFRKFPLVKKFMDKRGGGVSRFSVENFLSHSAENFCRWTP